MRDRLRGSRRQRAKRLHTWSPGAWERIEVGSDPCALGSIAVCPFRERCDGEAAAWHRARAGSRADFEMLYERWFVRVYRVASSRLGVRQLAETCTRDVLAVAFCLPPPLEGCAAAHVLSLLGKRLRWEEEEGA